MDEVSELTISQQTFSELSDRAEKSNFEDTDAYAEFLLEEVLYQLDEPSETPNKTDVQDRLRSLGYVE